MNLASTALRTLVIAGVTAVLVLSGASQAVIAQSTPTWILQIFNVDYRMVVRLNGAVVGECPQYEDCNYVLTGGYNENSDVLLLQLHNPANGWTYGYRLIKNGATVDEASCGVSGIVGCNANEYRTGLVWEKQLNKDYASAPIVWRGTAIISSGGCSQSGLSWGDELSVTFRPRFVSGRNDLSSNGADSYLTLFKSGLAVAHQFVNRDVRGAGPFFVNATAIAQDGGSFSYRSRVSNAVSSPSVIQSTTQTLSFSLEIQDFSGVIGCSVSLYGAAAKRQ